MNIKTKVFNFLWNFLWDHFNTETTNEIVDLVNNDPESWSANPKKGF